MTVSMGAPPPPLTCVTIPHPQLGAGSSASHGPRRRARCSASTVSTIMIPGAIDTHGRVYEQALSRR